MTIVPNASTCSRCRTPRPSGATACPRCGLSTTVTRYPPPPYGQGYGYPGQQPPPPPAPYPHPVYPAAPHLVVVASKTPAIAVLLSLWLGVGHLYARQTGVGLALLAYYGLLCVVSVIPFAFVVTVPLYLASFVVVAISASNAAKGFNRRNGVIER